MGYIYVELIKAQTTDHFDRSNRWVSSTASTSCNRDFVFVVTGWPRATIHAIKRKGPKAARLLEYIDWSTDRFFASITLFPPRLPAQRENMHHWNSQVVIVERVICFSVHTASGNPPR
ncbi:hypothetical protein ABKN59_006932 [Abortiporus biennis]